MFSVRILSIKWICPYSSSMLLSPKKAPSMSLVIPFLCIFNDLSESIPLKVKLSTIFILLRFISLQWQRVFVMNHFLVFKTNWDFAIYLTYRNWSCGSLKSLDGSTTNLFLFSFRTSRVLEMFSKQPGSRTLILLLLKFLRKKQSNNNNLLKLEIY